MPDYRLEVECEHSNCPARHTYEVDIHNHTFRFCTHHARKILKDLGYPEDQLANTW